MLGLLGKELLHGEPEGYHFFLELLPDCIDLFEFGQDLLLVRIFNPPESSQLRPLTIISLRKLAESSKNFCRRSNTFSCLTPE